MGPVLAAMLVGVFLNLIALSSKGSQRVSLQYFLFSSTSIISLSYLVYSSSKFSIFLLAFAALTFGEQFLLILLFISAVWLVMMGSTSLSDKTGSDSSNEIKNVSSPACIDRTTTFDVPDHLPENDNDLFNYAFERSNLSIKASLGLVTDDFISSM